MRQRLDAEGKKVTPKLTRCLPNPPQDCVRGGRSSNRTMMLPKANSLSQSLPPTFTKSILEKVSASTRSLLSSFGALT